VRWLFWILLIVAIATGLSLLANYNAGYVLIVRPPFRLELSLNLLLLLIVLSFGLLHFILRLSHYIKALPSSVKQYKEQLRLKSGHQALRDALHALVQGQYLQAEKSAAKALSLGEDAGLSALIAARASHKLKHKTQREFYLAEAERLAPEAAVARLMIQAELLLDDRQYEETIQTLRTLDKLKPHYAPAMRLEIKARVHLQQWEQVLHLLKLIEKSDILETWHIREIRQQAHQQLIQRLTGHLGELTHYWNQLTEDEKLNARIALSMVQTLLQGNSQDAVAATLAADIIGINLTKKWDSTLAALLGRCHTEQPQKYLQQAEFWLPQHQADADLLRSLGQLCLQLKLWGKAQTYLEASLSVNPTHATHLALAALFEQQGAIQDANKHYRLSAELISVSLI
jgi:HemY protein